MDNWAQIIATVREWSRYFPDGLVAIGGMATYLHAQALADARLLEVSHDGDIYLSLADYSDLRDIEEVVHNNRLHKAQIEKRGVDYDLYIEHQSHLVVPFDDVVRHSVTINDIRCASLEHLLVLKLDAALDRAGSAKGEKDRRDVVRLVLLLENPQRALVEAYWRPEFDAYLVHTGKSRVFVEMAHGNTHDAAIWRRRYDQHLQALLAAPSDSGTPGLDPR